jgi:hypothetical protein
VGWDGSKFDTGKALQPFLDVCADAQTARALAANALPTLWPCVAEGLLLLPQPARTLMQSHGDQDARPSEMKATHG